MENIDPAASVLNRQFFHHFTGQHHHQLSNSYPHSHAFNPHLQPATGNSQSGGATASPSIFTGFSSACSFSPATFASAPAPHTHASSLARHPEHQVPSPLGCSGYPSANTLHYLRDSYSESSSPNLNASSGSLGFRTESLHTPYTPSPSESDSLDQADSISSCDPNGMTAVELLDEDDDDEGEGGGGGGDEDGSSSETRRHRHRYSRRSRSPVHQRRAANLRERRRMQSINEAFEVREALTSC